MNEPQPQHMPYDHNAESDLCAAVLADEAVYLDLSGTLKPEDFHEYAHQLIWRIAGRLAAKSKPINAATVFQESIAMKATDDLSAAHLAELFANRASCPPIKSLAEIVRKKAMYRDLIRMANRVANQAFAQADEPQTIVIDAETEIFNIGQRKTSGEVVSISEAMTRALDTIDRRAGKSSSGEIEESLQTGWGQFDRLTGGIHKRSLTILAARPSVGKTIMAGNVIAHVASNGASVYFASIEQGVVEIAHRWLAKKAQVNGFKFLSGRFNDMEMDRIVTAANEMRSQRIWINDNSNQSGSSIASNARRIKARHGLDIVVVDYLQIARAENTRGSRSDQVGEISWRLKQIAKDLDVAVLCLAQLNRNVENRAGDEPRLSDLRDSGNIEQDADCVVFMHKPEPPSQERETDLVKFLIRKQRNGPLGDVTLVHAKKTFEIHEMAGGNFQ